MLATAVTVALVVDAALALVLLLAAAAASGALARAGRWTDPDGVPLVAPRTGADLLPLPDPRRGPAAERRPGARTWCRPELP